MFSLYAIKFIFRRKVAVDVLQMKGPLEVKQSDSTTFYVKIEM